MVQRGSASGRVRFGFGLNLTFFGRNLKFEVEVKFQRRGQGRCGSANPAHSLLLAPLRALRSLITGLADVYARDPFFAECTELRVIPLFHTDPLGVVEWSAAPHHLVGPVVRTWSWHSYPHRHGVT